LRQRRSVRAFRPDPVPRALVEEILDIASRAPSGTNVQPWKIHVAAGEVRERLEREVLAHRETMPPDGQAEFARTSKRKEPYVSRMRKLGKDMYTLLGIPKGDQGANWRQWGRNYQFFDAPVGLILTVDKDLDAMSFLDTGMFARPRHLRARGVEQLLDGDAAGAGGARRSVHRLRHIDGLRRRGRAGERPGLGARAGGRVRDLPRILRAMGGLPTAAFTRWRARASPKPIRSPARSRRQGPTRPPSFRRTSPWRPRTATGARQMNRPSSSMDRPPWSRRGRRWRR